MGHKSSIGDYAWLILLAAIFGSSFLTTKISVHSLPPMFVVFARMAVASAILLTMTLMAGKWFPRGRIWFAIIGSAMFGLVLPFSLLSWGQQKVDAGLAAILMASMPLFTLLLAQVFTNDEKPNRYSFVGFAIALAGIVVLFGPERLLSLADQSLRQYAVIGAALSYGVNAIITKQLTGLDWQQSSLSIVVAALFLSLPMLLLEDLSNLNAPTEAWLATLYSGVMPTAIGSVLIILIVRRTSASFLSQINFLVPLFGVVFAIVLLNEALPENGGIALMIILVGVALARRRPKREQISINKGA
jgi:drug/metabolite transporter (DMT)-like permease